MGAMKYFVFAIILGTVAAIPQVPPSSDHPEESEHRAGPRDIEGWTLDSPIPDGPDGSFAFTLVLSRYGKIIRRINGDPFIWRWIFWDRGRRVAYETGPLHFAMECNLVDVPSGRVIQSVDCFHDLPDNPPAWLSALETAGLK